MEHSKKPLTSEQLKEMVGKPVWSAKDEEWFLICKKDCEYLLYDKNGFCISLWDVFDYGLYAQPPTYIYSESRELCEYCGGEKTLYQQTNSTNLFMNAFGKAATLVTECNACPPYADCCMKGISANSAFEINFCPNCGRPLTDEAWDLLEKRIGV